MKTSSVDLRLKPGKSLQGQRHKYRILEKIGEGGSGLVYRAQTMPRGDVVAVKLFLPLYQLRLPLRSETQQQAVMDLQKLHQKELSCLQNINHPNIVRLVDHGRLPASDADVSKSFIPHDIPFFVMEYIDGVTMDEFLKQATELGQSDAVRLLVDIASTLTYLHKEKEYIHGDLRPSNVLIKTNTVAPILIDFAFYKNFNFNEVSRSEFTKLVGDQAFMPREFANAPLQQTSEIEGTREELKKQCLPGLDLYQFGKLLESLEVSFERILAPSDFEFYRRLKSELCNWKTAKGLSAKWLHEQLMKLDPSYSQFMGVEELCPPSGARRTIQIPGRVVTTSRLVDDLLNTRSFRRLNAMNQLLFVELLYPGATHKRYLHSLRAYAYCADMIESLAQTPHFRMFVTPMMARQALVLSLLHDINHFPLLHVFQEMRGNYMSQFNILDLFCDGEATNDNPSIYSLIQKVEISAQMFNSFFSDTIYQLAGHFEPGLQIIKSLLDSGADIDKLAYLHDDSLFTGVAYGHGIDAPRLIASATVAQIPQQPDVWHIAFREEGLAAVESLIMARYWMFRSVYWHRMNRAVIAMLLHVIRSLYVLKEADAGEFIKDTMWMQEDAVLDYLNKKYKDQHNGRDSIIHNLLREPRSVYVRLFSLQCGSSDSRESVLYNSLQQLDPNGLEEYRKTLAAALADFFRQTYGNRDSLGDDDVLLDIPGRRLENMGEIYIVLDSGQVEPISKLTGPVQPIIAEFERIAKRLRVFVHPRVLQYVSPSDIISKRNDILKLMDICLPKSKTALVK